MPRVIHRLLRPQDEEGFTLIELMVVVLIIAILLAIAIPTFLGARSRAQDRAAQSNLRTALTAEKTAYTDSQVYVDSTVTGSSALSTIESSMTYQATAPTAGTNQVEVFVSGATTTGPTVCLIDKSSSGTTFVIQDTGSGTYYGDSNLSGFTVPTNQAACTAGPLAGSQSTTALGWV